MPIYISKTYEIVTEESAEFGEAEERGFDFENAEFEFRELVDYIVRWGYILPSCYPGVPGWLSTEPDIDYQSGEYTTYSIHPGRDRMSQKYWEKACRAAGIIK